VDQLDKTFTMAQQALYLDVNVNSNRGLYTPLEHLETVSKVVHDLDEVCGVVFMSPRKCSKVRGRLSNYSFCLQPIRPFIAPSFIGGHRNTGDRDWDREKAIKNEMRDALSLLLMKHMGLWRLWCDQYGGEARVIGLLDQL
jgi:hypothetical protein